MKSDADIVIVILAAGPSSRLGQPKQLIKWQGEPLLRLMVQIALQTSAGHIVVVLGAHAEKIIHILDGKPVHVTINTQWPDGIGSSIRHAVRIIKQNFAHTKAVIFMVCDQPFLTTEHLQKLINHYLSYGSPIIASFYNGIAGVPALFDKAFFNKLLQLKPDEGAGKIIRSSLQTAFIDFPEGKFDIDTSADLRELENRTV